MDSRAARVGRGILEIACSTQTVVTFQDKTAAETRKCHTGCVCLHCRCMLL
jgi:hypothetical protein